MKSEAVAYRWMMLGLVLATTAAATLELLAIFRVDGVSPLEWPVLALFAFLFSWIAASFWVACLGAYELWNGAPALPLHRPPSDGAVSRSRTALTVPIYNESWPEVSARIQAMQDSLDEAGALDRFDFFILSDSTDPRCRADEEAGWRQLHNRRPDAGVYYRHRANNVGRKSGNIADFCVNWGTQYDYMVVLDADSLMAGRTLVRVVGLMDSNPRAGLIQVAPLLVGGESLFARIQQFASWAYGPVYTAGLAKLQGADGNYWGHNAIIRVRLFMQHCGLPILAGGPPFGGEIMSHDFVEAALLRRAGWDIWLISQPAGSFEATPPTLIDHLKRDQRWCQGNLQHIKLIFARGFRTQSRIHLAFGAISYLSSPLWLLLLVLFSADAARLEAIEPFSFVGPYPVINWPISHTAAFLSLIAATAVLLYVPKFLAVAILLRDANMVRRFGGAAALTTSALAETVASTLLAPVLMLSHSWFVVNALIGRRIEWGKQQRISDGVGLRESAVVFAPHTIVAVAAGVATWYWLPGIVWWFLPVLIGLTVASMLCWTTAKRQFGLAARRRGLFLVPSEAARIPIVEHVTALLADPATSRGPQGDAGGGTLQAV